MVLRREVFLNSYLECIEAAPSLSCSVDWLNFSFGAQINLFANASAKESARKFTCSRMRPHIKYAVQTSLRAQRMPGGLVFHHATKRVGSIA